MTRRDFANILLGGGIGLAAITAGCGGGGSNSSPSSLLSPTAATRARVLALHGVAVRGAMQSGFQPQNMAFALNGSSGGAPEIGSGGTPAPSDSSGFGPGVTLPLLGAFLRNVASVSPGTRAARLRSRSRDEGNSSGSGSGIGIALPPDPDLPPIGFPIDPPPTFYFDYYLGLWVQIEESESASRYLLFEDEEKTRSAGHITTENPTDWETFPQIFKSSYEFTSGYLAGSHGSSENRTNADYSGSSLYENVYSDGWADQGASSWSARGDFSWSSRTDGVNGEWSEGAGSFRADGSGGTRLSSSDGYKSDYRYNADGSGHGRVTGPDAGLPASISWDAYGNTTIVYADGSTEHISGWGWGAGGGEPIPVDPIEPPSPIVL